MIEADTELPVLLRHLVEEACSLVDARYGALSVLNESRTGLEEFVTVGLSEEEERQIGSWPTGRGVLHLPTPLRVKDLAAHPAAGGFPPHHPKMTSFLGVPVCVRGEIYGNLYVTDKQSADEFSEEDEAMAAGLALAAGICIENTRLHDLMRLLSVLNDRDRIARDLHDRIIQRVFAVGMMLQGTLGLPELAQVFKKIDRAIDELDNTVTEIRTAIFELGSGMGPHGLRQRVLDLVEGLTSMLGSRPEVTFHGPIDGGLSQDIADNVIAVMREALTNTAKHAHATRIRVTLTVGDNVQLDIADDGSGMKVPNGNGNGNGLGLTNLANRARGLGGTFEVAAAEGGGTRVLWRVPC